MHAHLAGQPLAAKQYKPTYSPNTDGVIIYRSVGNICAYIRRTRSEIWLGILGRQPALPR